MKISSAICGLLSLAFGIGMLDGGTTWREITVEPWVGYVLIPFGILLLIEAAIAKDSDEATMCPSCNEAHHWKLKGKPCPKCGTIIEPLEGYYDRHPELKTNPPQETPDKAGQ